MKAVVVPESRVFYAFDPSLEPAAFAKPGDLVVFHTLDALGGQVKSEEDLVTAVDFSRVNPATGPLYVEGAEPGDALVVKLLSIETSEQGFVVTAPGAGALPDLVKKARTRRCTVREGFVEFLGYRLPAWKMVGVIGVATSEKAPTGVPGRHGGNLDTKFVTEGATVYLPVEHPGALLGVGDLHALMAHGEVCVAACEVSGRVTALVDVARGLAPAWPLVDYGDSLYVLVSSEDVSGAIRGAVEASVEALSRALGLEWHDAYMLASLAVDIGVSQLVDPRKTAWARIPKQLAPPSRVLRALAELRNSL